VPRTRPAPVSEIRARYLHERPAGAGEPVPFPLEAGRFSD